VTATPHLGYYLSPEHTTWPDLRAAVLLADELRFDSIWNMDHFVPLSGNTSGPIFEAWQLMAAWGAITTHVRVGVEVTGITYRHPAVLANMVATLDHITNGRAILGLGGAWHEEEHAMYGIPFPGIGARLDLLEEACAAIRMLLDEPIASLAGAHVTLTNAVCEPKPIQARLPILIGGGGEKKTLRTTARHADYWHTASSGDRLRHKLDVLRRHCDDAGRDADEIVTLADAPYFIVLRDTAEEARAYLDAYTANSGDTIGPDVTVYHQVDPIVDWMVEQWRIGARGFIFASERPYDDETMRRVAAEVRPRLLQAI
jgi:alkanesulfonate monooxygenase SsuD/methylene tetrahydromethanopterin reductase-like flavin-dependent oxidoreductase (luciferase family)